jgi:hypothetical protein
VAQWLGTYLVIRMWFEKQLPSWFKVRRIKRLMRTTLVLWLITAALGITIYVTWYVTGSAAGDGGEPVATPEVTATADQVDEALGPAETAEAETEDVEPTEAAPEETPESADDDLGPAETPEATP